ncbi:MAG: magnesium transporter CorA family protein [bacterium]
MITKRTYKNETWVDIDHGTPEEILSIMDTYAIHPMVARDLTSATPKSRIEFHNGYIYCILHFPVYKHSHSDTEQKEQEVDFVIGKNVLVTARYDTIDALDKFGKIIEVKEILEKKNSTESEMAMFTGMIRELYGSIFEELEYIEDVTDGITAKIFKGKEKEMVVSISEMMRVLIDFKKTTDFHKEILEMIYHRGGEMFGDSFAKDMRLIILDYLKINTTIHNNLETLRELRDTNNSLLTSKQNETVKQLTVLNAIVLPLDLIAFIFAMRTNGMPLIDNPNAFWIVITLMCTITLITLTFIKHKKWL